MTRLFDDFQGGELDADPGAAGTSISSPDLSSMMVVGSPDTLTVVLDPHGVNGAPEIVYVTAHTASATSATVTRGQEGTAGRAHPIGTAWVAPITAADAEDMVGGGEPAVLIPAPAFVAVNGTPVLGDAGADVGGFLFDAAGTERVGTFAVLPAHWLTYDLQFVWTNAGVGSGNVHWDIGYSAGFGNGESAGLTIFDEQDVAAPAQNTAKFTTMATGIAVPSSGELVPIRPGRAGADAGDTLGNDAALLAVKLVQAS